ncbi:MotA/TolQ/ExbB proton channel family protein [Helicobacter sp. MIT 99-5507]|uniref:MotA/TolQ/ExbB proton channel family protein n=1 Tax=Helicobacter sp. MIT 99-5507 TaxID=152489 RepID=UPI000E1E2C76|nr:MotA/TolQ/ExbB proton channel family protein [Helicobacter sp. MIT 99-5507]RDU58386.1 MotA/TolQ/ExbB proton channel family protein [Helicobacter sp. MIT 99-5507]
MSSFVSDIGAITWFVLIWLSIYFIANIWIFLWRFFKLSNIIALEKNTLELLYSNHLPIRKSIFFSILDSKKYINVEVLNVYKLEAVKKATAGLSMLSVISSTAPFIGLFGTVIEILQAFYHLGGDGKISFDVIAPIISKALVATAFGILTAIPAYSFYILLRRKAYEFTTYLDMQINIIVSTKNTDSKNVDSQSIDSKITLK